MLEQKNYGLGVSVNPGLLDTPLTLKKVTGSTYDDLNRETINTSSNDIMGYFKPLSGSESGEGGKETVYLRAKCIIRYYPGLNEKDWIVRDGIEWDIETADSYGKNDMYHLLNLRKRV